MARYKHIDTSPRFLAVDLSRQLIPGTFEHALNYLLDHEIDLSRFDKRFKNDVVGAAAYPPAMLLKVVLFAYSQGIVSSRGIEAACREHVTFIALCGDTSPHFTTLADFVSTLGEEVAHVFGAVLAICEREGLIGREMFAIDGVKLPGNASKRKSGARSEFARQAEKLERAARTMLARHREEDAKAVEPTLRAKEVKRVERLHSDAQQIGDWLVKNPKDRRGVRRGKRKASVRKSNRTDNESAKMATSKGVIQGYTGVAAVDVQHQIIVCAQAHGTASEQEVLMPVVEEIKPILAEDSLLTADAGYHSEDNLKELADRKIEALIADNGMRGRDERFADQEQHQAKPDPLWDKTAVEKKQALFGPPDFLYDEEAKVCICPAGEFLYQNGSQVVIQGREAVKFTGAKRVCGPCPIRDRCLRHPDRTPVRQVVFFTGKNRNPESHTQRMKHKIDSEEGRRRYGERFATVELVFGNLRYNKGLDRFTLRGQTKVDAQWKLFCLVHNIEKLAHHGYAQKRSEEDPPAAALSARLRHEPCNDSLRRVNCDRLSAIAHAREQSKKRFSTASTFSISGCNGA
ncbi:MAG: IS1182 family transposase [Gammaproteobacteria bacterium]|nr:IS1182 family transposase [Gammaproteobacteria bacterium]MDH3413598.1 IS1182 family transposase [Gammaproteobacteria bacterium]